MLGGTRDCGMRTGRGLAAVSLGYIVSATTDWGRNPRQLVWS